MYEKIMEYKSAYNITGESLMEVILSYCEHKGLDIDEVGMEIKKDKVFVETLKYDLINRKQANFESTEDILADWI